MKNFSLTTFKALHLAAFASLALLAMVSSAHAGGGTMTTHTVELRTGNDTFGNPLLPTVADGNITRAILTTGGMNTPPPPTPAEFVLAEYGGVPARVIDPTGIPYGPFPDTNTRWINGTDTAWDDESALYAHPFDLPLDMPAWASVTLNIDFLCDDRLQALYFRSDATGPIPKELVAMGNPQGGWFTNTNYSVTMTANDLGLSGGRNTLFFHQHTVSTVLDAATRYSATLSLSYCAVNRDLRSGIDYDSNAQSWLSMLPGSPDLDVLAQPLPNGHTNSDFISALSDLKSDIGVNPKVLSYDPLHGNTSEASAWIDYSDDPSLPDECVLYSHKFNLPNLNPTDVAYLELEWVVDNQIGGIPIHGSPGAVFINNLPPLPVTSNSTVTGGFTGGNYATSKTATIRSTVAGLKLVPGPNRLFILQEVLGTSSPGTTYSSGISYVAKLKIITHCEESTFESFCDCPSTLAPCGNHGLTPDQGCANSTSKGASLTPLGQAEISLNSLHLEANNLPFGSVGLFFEGTNTIGQIPFGDGLRCVVGHIRRIDIAFEDGTRHAKSGLAPLPNPPVPCMRYYQFWYRDTPSLLSPCQAGFNLSRAVGVPWVL